MENAVNQDTPPPSDADRRLATADIVIRELRAELTQAAETMASFASSRKQEQDDHAQKLHRAMNRALDLEKELEVARNSADAYLVERHNAIKDVYLKWKIGETRARIAIKAIGNLF